MSVYDRSIADQFEQRGHSTGLADELPELTYVPDLGSDQPQEDMMEPTGSAIDAMTTAMKRAKARLALVAPKGAQPSVSWEHRLTTYSDGSETLTTHWTVAVYLNSASLAFARADVLDDAVLKCVATLVEQRQAFRESTGGDAAGLDKVADAIAAA